MDGSITASLLPPPPSTASPASATPAAAPADAIPAGGPREGAPASFVVDLQSYSGPLDLLLGLIRDEQVDIYDIPIARIAEQFLARIRHLALNEAADYLEMAARLLRIKAQMLLPRNEQDDAWEDPRADLVRRLLEYQQMREIVERLESRAEARRSRFARAYLPQQPAAALPPLALSLGELLSAVDRILRAVRQPLMHDVVSRALDVPGAIATVRAVLALRASARLADVLRRGAEPWEILSTLLALLELAKLGECRLEQPAPFAALEIIRDVAGEAA